MEKVNTRWLNYVNQHNDKLQLFREFWPNPDDSINSVRVAVEMELFYKSLSVRIHDAAVFTDVVWWHRRALTPVQNKIAQYMCEDLYIQYIIVEAGGEDETIIYDHFEFWGDED